MTHITNAPTNRINLTDAVRARSLKNSPASPPQAQTPTQESRSVPTDQVQISHAARLLDAQKSEEPFRTDLVERIRTEIANGTYDQDAKLDRAIDGLLGEL